MRAKGLAVPRTRRGDGTMPEELERAGVTKREADVLALIGDGLSNAEIAAKLYLSVRTVESHTSSLIRRLGVDGRPGLIATAVRLRSGG